MNQPLTLAQIEREKYLRVYGSKKYSTHSPHWRCLTRVREEIEPHKEYANFGCGSGLLDRFLLETSRGILVDHVNALLPEVAQHPNLAKFVEASLFEEFEHFEVPYAVSTDVMEHIPPEKVDVVLDNIARRTPECFFQISLDPTSEKKAIKYGGHLHLTVETPEWWRQRLLRHFGTLSNPQLDPHSHIMKKGWFVVTAKR